MLEMEWFLKLILPLLASGKYISIHRSHTLPGIVSVMENGKRAKMGGERWETEEEIGFCSPP